MKRLHCCDSVLRDSFVRAGCTWGRWGGDLCRRGYRLPVIPLPRKCKRKFNHHHHHYNLKEFGHLLTRSGLTYYSLSYPTVILNFSWYSLFSQTRKWRPSHSGITVSPGMEEMPSLNMPVQRLKVAIIPLDLPCSGPVTHSGEILTSGKSHGKKSDRFS